MSELSKTKKAASLDQYFTKPTIAEKCLDKLLSFLVFHGFSTHHCLWIEPSAGNGAFVDHLNHRHFDFWAGDIEPKHSLIHRHDYLKYPLPQHKDFPDQQSRIIIGNPPFGKKSKLVIEFINKSLTHGHIVGFIVPIHMRKWSAQKMVNADARLIIDDILPEDSFLFLNKPYQLRCCFQVWTTLPDSTLPGDDLRLTQQPKTQHPDFDAWQYNCTQQARKYFDLDWDFAVLRQGYGDFKLMYTQKDKAMLDTKKQWIFIKAKNPTVLNRLKSINFELLSQKNTGTPGFGKADLVSAYEAKLKKSTKAFS